MSRFYYSGARDVVESTRKFSIFWLRKKGYLKPEGWRRYGNIHWSIGEEPAGNINFEIDTIGDNPFIRFIYRTKPYHDDGWKDMNYKFDLVSNPCRFGGKRWFFKCGLYKDGIYCGQKAAILYNVGNYFGCRHCANLSYQSCNNSRKGFIGIISKLFKADECYGKLKRFYYRGQPTRKHQKCLRLSEWSKANMHRVTKYDLPNKNQRNDI